ncbi:MAG: MotE family protein [Alphaproteobacteria bacterium]
MNTAKSTKPVKSTKPAGMARAEKRSWIPRLRLLPVVMFVAGLMLSVRLGGLWEDFVGGRHIIGVALEPTRAQAQSPAPAAQPSAAQRRASAEGGGSGSRGAESEKSAAQESEGEGSGKGDKGEEGAGSLGDPTTFTQNEINLLQKLAEHREVLDGRARELDAREALLSAAEERINAKIGEIKSLQQTIQKLIAKYNELEDNKLKSLVNIYEKMKPKDAARIFNDLEMPTLMAVIERMKDTKTAPIMAEMDSARAKALTSELAQRNRLPATGVGGGG